jgi:hypothetical protein
MTLMVLILICIALILVGAVSGKPIGWVILTLATIALLLAVLGGASIHIGR